MDRAGAAGQRQWRAPRARARQRRRARGGAVSPLAHLEDLRKVAADGHRLHAETLVAAGGARGGARGEAVRRGGRAALCATFAAGMRASEQGRARARARPTHVAMATQFLPVIASTAPPLYDMICGEGCESAR